jgi:integrase
MRQQMFSVADFPTERALRKHLATSIAMLNGEQEKPLPVITTVGDLIARYRKEVLPELARSTRGTYESTFTAQILPQWVDTPVTDLRPMAVDKWLKSLDKISTRTKVKARRLLKQLIDKAMYWEIMPVAANPMCLVKIKGATKRTKAIVLLEPEQVTALISSLPEPYNIMVMIGSCLGLRVEEIAALQWDDFNFSEKTVRVQRAYTHGELKEVKTEASLRGLPIPNMLCDALQRYRESVTSPWLFPNARHLDRPRWMAIALQNHIQPIAEKIGLPHIGWHSLRHSYRSWIGAGAATLSEQKDLMGHSSISTTLNVYGGTSLTQMRPLVETVADLLQPKQP